MADILDQLLGNDTFPKLLVRNAGLHPDRVAMREKEFGIWQPFTWREYHDHVRDFSMGLVALGMQPGDKVAIIGDNRPGVGVGRGGRPGRRRRLGGALPGLQPHRGGLRHRPLRRHLRGGRGPGAGRQDPRHARQAAQGAQRRLHRPARPPEVRAPEAPLLRVGRGEGAGVHRRTGPAPGRSTSGAAGSRTWPSSATPRAPPGFPRGRCSPSGTCSPWRSRSTRWTPSSPRTSSSPSSRWPGSASR